MGMPHSIESFQSTIALRLAHSTRSEPRHSDGEHGGKAITPHSAIRVSALKSPPSFTIKMAKFTAAVLTIAAVAASLTNFATAHDGEEHGSGSMDGDDDAVVDAACAANVSSLVVSTLENVTFFDSCANGTKFSFTTLLDAAKLPPTDFLTWCNSSVCMQPLHHLLAEAPLTCLVTYKGSAQNLTGEITKLHDKCHAVKDAAKAAAGGSNASNTTGATPAPSPTPSSATTLKGVAFAVAGVVTAASFLF